MKMSKMTMVVVLFFSLISPFSLLGKIPPPPPEVNADYGFAALNEETMATLLKQGSMLIVRQNPDLTLINVTAGALVDAPLKTVWETITDFDNYPQFMPQTKAEKIIEQEDNRMLVEQEIGVSISRLPPVTVTYKLAQDLTPNNKVRFWHVEGTLKGTYGGWDLVPVQRIPSPKDPSWDGTGDKTMIFYTLYSNLTALGWGLGKVFESQPDFMAGVNVTTTMMVIKAVKKESERRYNTR